MAEIIGRELVGTPGFELEASSRRLSLLPKSRAQPRDQSRIAGVRPSPAEAGSPFFYLPQGPEVWGAFGRANSLPWAIPLREEADLVGFGADYRVKNTNIHAGQSVRTYDNPANLQGFSGLSLQLHQSSIRLLSQPLPQSLLYQRRPLVSSSVPLLGPLHPARSPQHRRDFLRKPQADPEFLGQLF